MISDSRKAFLSRLNQRTYWDTVGAIRSEIPAAMPFPGELPIMSYTGWITKLHKLTILTAAIALASSVQAQFEDAPPLPLPAPPEKVATQKSAIAPKLIRRDLRTGRIDIMPQAGGMTGVHSGALSLIQPTIEHPFQDQGIINYFSALVAVEDPTQSPWPVICKLYTTIDGVTYQASGTLIDAKHVITAGHVVNDGAGGSWATAITAVPAFDYGAEPYGRAEAIGVLAWDGWTDYGEFDHDIGLIELERPVGTLTGWQGFGSHPDDYFFLTNTFHTAGYPAAVPFDGRKMYSWYGPFDIAYPYQVYAYNQAYGGQSGSGGYQLLDVNNRVVYSILSNGNDYLTGYVRITANKFNTIVSTMQSVRPTAADLIPLGVQAQPASIEAGETLTEFNFAMINYASGTWAGPIQYQVYLSDDAEITTSDTLLAADQVSWVASPLARIRTPAALATIPETTPAGTHYLGVFLNTLDADTSNNITGIYDVAEIEVTCASIGEAGDVVASFRTLDDVVELAWDPAPNAVLHDIWRSTTDDPGSATRIAYEVSGDTYLDMSVIDDHTYYYWVSGKRLCGSSGPLSGGAVGQAIAPHTLGDLNCDGFVNSFDIDPFVMALINPLGYQQTFPGCNRWRADVDLDTIIGSFDIDPFVAQLLGR
jgi:V8-like Glu-specific endopeptidase